MGQPFASVDWEHISRDWGAWWEGELGRPIVTIESVSLPVDVPPPFFFAASYPLTMPVDEVLDRYEARLAATVFHADAFPQFEPDFGPGILAGFLGAPVQPVPDDTVWFGPLPAGALAVLQPRAEPDGTWWPRVRELTSRAAERWAGQVAVGITDLGSSLDVLAHLRGAQQLLLDLVDEPEAVERLVDRLDGLWQRYYDELYALASGTGRGTTHWAGLWLPGRGYMLQCDFSYMISPAMFDRFVLPSLHAACEAMDHCFYHLDGEEQLSHLDALLALPRLRGVQTVPCARRALEEPWLSAYRRIRAAGKLVQPWGASPELALAVARELGARGFAFRIERNMPPAEAREFLRLLEAEEAGQQSCT